MAVCDITAQLHSDTVNGAVISDMNNSGAVSGRKASCLSSLTFRPAQFTLFGPAVVIPKRNQSSAYVVPPMQIP